MTGEELCCLGIFFPDFFEDKFFLPIYKENEEGRIAEIGWKVRYATLGLLLTALSAGEVIFFADRGSVQVLRDSYILWAIFYTEALRKIRAEAKADILRKPGTSSALTADPETCFIVFISYARGLTSLPLFNFCREAYGYPDVASAGRCGLVGRRF